MNKKSRNFWTIVSIYILVTITISIRLYFLCVESQELTHEKIDEIIPTERILDAPGEIFLLNTKEDKMLAKIDLNCDDIPEYISVKGCGVNGGEYATEGSFGITPIELSIGDAVYVFDNTEDLAFRNVFAVSPDGELIYIGLKGNSTETNLPITYLFAYDGKCIKYVYSAYIDVLDETTVIGTEQISAILQVNEPIKNTVRFTWKKNSDGIYRVQFEDEYVYLEKAEYELKTMIPLFSTPDRNAVKISEIGKQNVWLLRTKLDGAKNASALSSGIAGDYPSWIFLRTETGVEGWIQVGNRMVNVEGDIFDTSDVLVPTA